MKENPDNDGPEQAVIFVPPGSDRDRWIATCLAYCAEQGYRVFSVLDSWQAVLQVLQAREAHVVVVARREDPPRHRRPRIEVVSDQPQSVSPRQRRPRRRTWVAR